MVYFAICKILVITQPHINMEVKEASLCASYEACFFTEKATAVSTMVGYQIMNLSQLLKFGCLVLKI